MNFVKARRSDEEHEQAERPGVAPRPGRERVRPARGRAADGVGRGGHASPSGAGSRSGGASARRRRRLRRGLRRSRRRRPPRRSPRASPRPTCRLYAARSSVGSSASADVDLGHDPAAEDHDRPVAGELDLLELRGVEQDRRAGLGEVAEQHVDLVLRAGCRCRASGRSRASSGRRRRPSGRSSPSAGCRPTAAGPRRRRGRRSGACRSRSSTLAAPRPQVDQAPVAGSAAANGRAMFSRTERCISRASARSAAT